MGKNNTNRICQTLFWIKFTFAFAFALSGIGFLVWKVKDGHDKALKEIYLNRVINTPITLTEDCRPKGSRLLPPEGKVFVGFSVDWQQETPVDIVKKLDYVRPAIYNAFLRMEQDGSLNYNYLQWHAETVARVGGSLQLTIQPQSLNVPDSAIERLANTLRDINYNLGVPVYLRYGHEMNGWWESYSLKPLAYVRSFRKVSQIVHSLTNMTALVWSPNNGPFYPYSPPNASYLPTDPAELRALDTDGNGLLNVGDDPYMPYYPGDEYVDWVGLSIYYYTPDYYPSTYNSLPAGGYLVGLMTSTDRIYDFYRYFVIQRNKPMMLAETGAPFIRSAPHNWDEVSIKREWWNQVFSAMRDYPMLRIALNFEETKADAGSQVPRDWRVLNNTAVASEFKRQISSQTSIAWADHLKYSCDGTIQNLL